MNPRFLLIVAALFSWSACSRGIYLPEGDAGAGRLVFSELECYQCHRVAEEDFPAPTIDPPVPVVLGSPLNRKSRNYLAESIIAPSHRFAKPPRERVYSEPLLYRQLDYKNIAEGSDSRMNDFNESMTVSQLVDLVAYLDSLQNRKPGD
jgi:L-cysteine S-thiosulfotransferase